MIKETETKYIISFEELKKALGIKEQIIAVGHTKLANEGFSFMQTYGIEVVVK